MNWFTLCVWLSPIVIAGAFVFTLVRCSTREIPEPKKEKK